MIRTTAILHFLKLGLDMHMARPRHVLLAGAGIAISVSVLCVLLAVPEGLKRLAANTGSNTIALVLDASKSGDEIESVLSTQDVAIVSTLPGISRDAHGKARVAPQFLAASPLRRRDGTRVSVQIRGVTAATLQLVHDMVGIKLGAPPNSGVLELFAGEAAANTFNLAPGDRLKIRDVNWRNTGVFQSHGSLWDSELWADMSALQQAFNAASRISVVWVKFDAPNDEAVFAQALENDPRVNRLSVFPQANYYQGRLKFIAQYARLAAIAIAATLGLCAALAISNALSLSFMARRRELAVLNAIGFTNDYLCLYLIVETVLLAAIVAGFILGLESFLIGDMAIETSSGMRAVAFHLALNGSVALWAFSYAVVLALLSALGPAWSVTHGPLRHALQGS